MTLRMMARVAFRFICMHNHARAFSRLRYYYCLAMMSRCDACDPHPRTFQQILCLQYVRTQARLEFECLTGALLASRTYAWLAFERHMFAVHSRRRQKYALVFGRQIITTMVLSAFLSPVCREQVVLTPRHLAPGSFLVLPSLYRT